MRREKAGEVSEVVSSSFCLRRRGGELGKKIKLRDFFFFLI